MEQPTSYQNRMEQAPKAAARLVTPRTGYEFDDPEGMLRRGVAVRADHPIAMRNRGAFMLAPEGCNLHPSVRSESLSTPTAPRTSKASENDEKEG